MSAFVGEGLFIGAKEGLKLAFCAFIILSYFQREKLTYLNKSFYVAVVVISLSSFIVLTTSISIEIRNVIVKMTGYVFGIVYLMSLGALYQATGTEILGPLRRVVFTKYVFIPLIFIITCLYFIPDMMGSALYVGDLYIMSEHSLAVILFSACGFVVTVALSYRVFRKRGENAIRLFGFPQILLFMALIKLLGGGIRGFTEFSLIPSVKGGLMKFIHDIVHQTLIMAMVPDHMLLKVTAWNFIGIFFGSEVALWLSLVIILLPLIIFIRKHFTAEIGVPRELMKGSERRKFLKTIKDERLLRSIPVLIFMLFIAGTWFIEKGESVSKLYNPDPIPVVVEEGKIVIPISLPGSDLRDGMLHKYSLTINEDTIRLLVIQKSDGTLAVCLDACEICPPDGYAQGDKHVVCLYCRTPIPIETLGKPGGCNPIPLQVLITESAIVIEENEIRTKWDMVKSGKTKEEIPKQ